MFGYNPMLDLARSNPDPHYRLYLSPNGDGVVAICVQDFDYRDYEDARFIGYEVFWSEAEAQEAVELAKVNALKILGNWPPR